MARPTKHYGKWRIRWVDANGQRQSEVFEDRREAAFQLQQRELEAEERRRGLKEPPTAPKAFADLADYWEKNRVPQKRSGHHDESILRRHLRPAFGAVTLGNPAVWIELVDKYVVERAHLNKKTVANHLTLLVTMLNVAVDLGWMTKVPRVRKPRVRLISQDYSYLRTDDEIARLLRSAKEEESDLVHVLYAMAIYTGMREGELAGLLWADVDLERRLITVQRSFDGPTKADDVRYVPILDALLPVLRDWRLRHPGRLVFTNRDGRMFLPSSRIFQEALHRVLDRAQFPRIERGGKVRRYVTDRRRQDAARTLPCAPHPGVVDRSRGCGAGGAGVRGGWQRNVVVRVPRDGRCDHACVGRRRRRRALVAPGHKGRRK